MEKKLVKDLLRDHGEEHVLEVAEELYSRYHRLIFHLMRVYNLPEQQLNDLFNNIFVKIMRGLSKIQHCDNMKSWVVTIARNEILKHYRKQIKETQIFSLSKRSDDERITVGEITPLFPNEEEIFHKQLHSAFQQIMAGMDYEKSQPFILRYQECLTWKEIAEKLDLNIDTARKRAERTKQEVLRLLHNLAKFKIAQ